MKWKNRRLNKKVRPFVDFVPLIDCAFTLIIFFAVTTTLITTRAGVDVNLPGAKTAEKMPQNVQISIKETGEIWFEDIPVTDDASLTILVQKKLKEATESSFIINADKTIPYELLVHVLDLIREAGARKIALAAEKVYEEKIQEK
ncbi:MAG: biopolymer transporter ExbD [bacterium]